MNLKILTKKITNLEEKLARLESRVNLSHSSLPIGKTRKLDAKYPFLHELNLNKLNRVISSTFGILKNKKLPKNPVAWQKQIRKEWD